MRRWLVLAGLIACGSDGAASTPNAVSTPELEGGPPGTPVARPDAGTDVVVPPATRCLADPVAAVNGLSDRGVLLGYHLNGFFDPSTTKHWEGVVRLEAAGARYLAVSRIGPEMFDVVELASRRDDGESLGPSRASESAAPPAEDKVVAKVDEEDGYDHAGGMQALGGVLAVPLENGKTSRVVFFDMTAPKTPKRLGALERTNIGEAGTAGWAKMRDGRTLLVVGRKGDQILDFYVSKTTTFEPAGWDLKTTWRVDGDGVKTKLADGDKNFGDYQNLAVVPDCNGDLFLIGTHREGILAGVDFVDLFSVTLDAKAVITKLAKRHVYCADDGEPAQCNLDAAAGAYITPSGKLHVYATEHDNDGPSGSIKMKEF